MIIETAVEVCIYLSKLVCSKIVAVVLVMIVAIAVGSIQRSRCM